MKSVLRPYFTKNLTEAGCDEAGRGCLAGPVFAAAVILPKDFHDPRLNDSKQLAEKLRYQLRIEILDKALAWSVARVDSEEIDEINILNASFKAMHLAIGGLKPVPQLLLIDGNRFISYQDIPHQCVIKGDGKFFSIAAASVLAKTFRDDYMNEMDKHYPVYHWKKNKGYPTKQHREAIINAGTCPLHRKSFNLTGQLKFDL